MLSPFRRALCRVLHGGFYYSRSSGECSWSWTSKYLTLTCRTKFRDCEESGLLKEFAGRVTLDESRMLDMDDKRIRTFWTDGYRIVQGGTMMDGRIMGGTVIREWGQPPERKVAKPIPLSLLNRTSQGATKR